MRKARIESILPGTKLAKAVFSSDGRILLSAGVEYKENYIEKLKNFNITHIYIEDDISKDIDFTDAVCDKTKIETKLVVKNIMSEFSVKNSVNVDIVKSAINKIVDELLANRNVLVNLSDLKSVDGYTYEHSVNVCVLSLVMGMSLKYSNDKLRDLGVGALLHDIGKLRIPEEILKKPSGLTVEEFEEVKKHTIYGYEILKGIDGLSKLSAYIALGHHERFDGSGYPMHLKGRDINQCARIVAVADVFDALSSDRVYRKKLPPQEVYEYITAMGMHYFDQEIVNEFIDCVAIYPNGTGVILNTGERGIVVSNSRSLPTRPVIRVVYDEDNKKLKEYYEIDLTKALNVFIQDICEI